MALQLYLKYESGADDIGWEKMGAIEKGNGHPAVCEAFFEDSIKIRSIPYAFLSKVSYDTFYE